MSLSEAADGDLVFRICTAPREGQIVRLQSTKCTIGSGERCTLRLRASGVSPVHCLIVRGAAATIIRRWSPDTRLNDQTFTDAELVPGDRIGIGPVDLEVIAVHPAQKVPAASRQEATPPPPPDASLERLRLELEQQRRSLEEQQRQWQLEREETAANVATEREQFAAERQRLETEKQSLADQRRQWESERQESAARLASQTEQLAAEQKNIEVEQQTLAEQQRQWEATHQETVAGLVTQNEQISAALADLQTQKQSLTAQQRQWESQHQESAARLASQTEQLAAEQKNIEVEKQTLAEQQRQWEATHQETVAGLATQNEQISAALADLQAQKQLLAEQQRQWESERQESAAEIAERSKQLAAQVAGAEVERQSLDGQRQQWQLEQTDAQRQLNQQRESLNAEKAELAAKQTALEEQRQTWECQRAAAASEPATSEPAAESETTEPEPTFELPAAKAPVDLAEVFRRVGATVDLVDESQDPTIEPAPASTLSPYREPQKNSATSAVAANGDEESIDDYMSRLMKRLRSASGDAVAPAYVLSPSQSSANASDTAKPLAETERPPISEPSIPAGAAPVELSPRAVAPERNVDLSALRELANLSAQSAISQHARQMLVHAMYSKLAVMLVALATGTTLLWMWKTLGAAQTTFYSALVALLVAIYWGMEYALLSGRLTIGRTGHLEIDWNKSPARADQSGHSKHNPDDATPRD
ncbi:MAG: FHA domain-containing protein [Thermoguttaceae bacterium]